MTLDSRESLDRPESQELKAPQVPQDRKDQKATQVTRLHIPTTATIILTDPVTGQVGRATYNPEGTTFNAVGAGFINGSAIQFICCTGNNDVTGNQLLSLGGRFFSTATGAWRKDGIMLPDSVEAWRRNHDHGAHTKRKRGVLAAPDSGAVNPKREDHAQI